MQKESDRKYFVILVDIEDEQRPGIVFEGEWGFEISSLLYSLRYADLVDTDTMVFSTRKKATRFAEQADLNARYRKPITGYRVVEVKPKYETILKGYVICKQTEEIPES